MKHSDALVIFGITGDLAYKKIFPSLFKLLKRGRLDVPIIGVARTDYNKERLAAHAKESLQAANVFDSATFTKFASQLHCVGGDYRDMDTFERLRRELGEAQSPLHYMAIPPALFTSVIRSLHASGCAKGARVMVEKPFGNDLESAQALNRALLEVFPEEAVLRIDHFLAKEPVENLTYFRFANSIFEALWNRLYVESVHVTMAESFGVSGRGSFYDATGAIRDVLQNHLLQTIASLAMEPPGRGEFLRDVRTRTIAAMRPLSQEDVVRGQFRGYRDEPDVPDESTTETYCAARLFIDNYRWAGVPFFVRSGKCLPNTVTEAHVIFKRPPVAALGDAIPPGATYLRCRLSPEPELALGMRIKKPGQEMRGRAVELITHSETASEMSAYERLIADGLIGDGELFATKDGVEAEWRVVDPVLKNPSKVHMYDPGTWGPPAAEALAQDVGGWRTPIERKAR